MSSKSISMYTILLAAFLTFALFSSNKDSTEAKSNQNSSTANLPQQIRAVDLNRSFDFAGEPLPMENDDVRERLDRELLRNSYYHSSTILNLKRMTRYFPVIESILAEEGVPQDMKYLAVAESSLSNAVSPSGAKGVWQFMKGTGKEYGMEINAEVDERYNLEIATRAACKYLKSKKERFGSWTLAAAAYNMGPSRLSSEMKVQRGKSYYDLNLNQETMKYVFRIVALKEIMSRPEDFGFYIESHEKYMPLESINIRVDKTIENLGDFAKKNGISYRTLKRYNPWLVSTRLPNKSRKNYLIKIPKNKF